MALSQGLICTAGVHLGFGEVAFLEAARVSSCQARLSSLEFKKQGEVHVSPYS